MALLTAAWGTHTFPIPKDMEAPCMRVVKLPHLSQYPVEQKPGASNVYFMHYFVEQLIDASPYITYDNVMPHPSNNSTLWGYFTKYETIL